MPFSKVDIERRIVSGFATLDNVDKQFDVVTAEASLNAFKKFRGNIREMHQPISVGKMVDFKEEKYFDPETKKFYSGVYVSAYISKGAQDTWEKVLDGTLSGFSIGGRMNKWDDAYDAQLKKAIKIIKDYELTELSLVDNPANQFANIMSIEKVDGVDVVKGDAMNTVLENVFYDAESDIVIVSEDEAMKSPLTEKAMSNIGFVEKNDNEKAEMIKFLVDSAKGINLSKMTKEVSPMTDTTENIVEKSDDVVEEAQVAPEADTATDVVVEKSDNVETEKSADYAGGGAAMGEDEEDEDEDEEMEGEDGAMKGNYKKKAEDATSEVATVDKSDVPEVSKSDDVVTEAIAEIRDGIATAFSDLTQVVKSLNEELADLKKSLNLANAKLADAERDFDEFGKRVDAIEADTAFRKSGDLGEIVQEQPNKVEKSLWGGRFLKTADLFR